MNANNIQNYSSAIFKDIIAHRNKNSTLKIAIKHYCKENNIIVDDLLSFIEHTINSFKPERELSLPEKIYWLANDMTDFPKCSLDSCDKKLTAPKSFRGIDYGYSKTCCISHGTLSAMPGIKARNLEKYGVEIPNQFNASKAFNDKYVQTCMEKYGTDHHCKADIVKTHVRETNIDRYGVEIVNQYNGTPEMMDKYLNTTHEKYNCDHYLQTVEKQIKSKQTCKAKYGVEFFTQSKEFAQKRPKNIHYDNLKFDSSWEVEVYKFCKNLGLDIKQAEISFEYTVDNEVFRYFPDFILNDTIIEVKGPHFFKTDNTGKLTMICPYRYDDWTDDYYDYMCKKYNAKYHCMLEHNVAIISDISQDNLTAIFSKFIDTKK